ncbi:PD-(D/E)XK nuclease superfamily protein [Desulfobotulus alkaliphilus]|uniref:PD-(D/E)XK nuclease superfamily protein n=2 Tax=Desulfobotulus alkaliphilus TaxID=622671 RepID=A0A562RW50_9BACT|nr:PD-(D/E)XK nuclease superfamily protein [Desulfobotulus alkaliphilus]
MRKRILYGEANYPAIVRENGYFVDKTAYIQKLELVKNTVFLRPRRFGKSLLCTMLESYYSVLYKENFEELFGHTWIGKNPTPLHNTMLVLHLDFSTIETGELEVMEKSFNHVVNSKIKALIQNCHAWLENSPSFDPMASATANLQSLVNHFTPNLIHPLYVIIDEYDNFANQLITGHKDLHYKQLMADDGFLKTFFKLLKEGRKTGAIHNVFITGVLPVTMDELASGFNIASFITLEPEFENMIGFTQSEVDTLLDEIYKDYEINPDTRNEIQDVIKNQYNGYHFIDPQGEVVYNSTILQYFLDGLTKNSTMPQHPMGINPEASIQWLQRLGASNPESIKKFVEELLLRENVSFDRSFTPKINMFYFLEKSYFPILFLHLGMLTRKNDFFLTLPNLNMKRIFVEYFNELHRIDVSTRYADMMQGFVNDLDLKALFAGYWQEYVSQLPEAVFSQVNENFYRTTFYELCSRYLSSWFTWNVERSYPKGRTDLEFVGKFNECFAGIRMVIEFKYFSNAAFKKLNTKIEDFSLMPEDTEQIAGYVEGLKKEYPEAKVTQHVIYCFGNGGFKVFDLE